MPARQSPVPQSPDTMSAERGDHVALRGGLGEVHQECCRLDEADATPSRCDAAIRNTPSCWPLSHVLRGIRFVRHSGLWTLPSTDPQGTLPRGQPLVLSSKWY